MYTISDNRLDTARRLAEDRPRFVELDDADIDFDGIQVDIPVCDVTVPFGLIDATVTVIGCDAGYELGDVKISLGEYLGQIRWWVVGFGEFGGMGEGPGRAMFDAIIANIRADEKFEARAMDALIARQLGEQ